MHAPAHVQVKRLLEQKCSHFMALMSGDWIKNCFKGWQELTRKGKRAKARSLFCSPPAPASRRTIPAPPCPSSARSGPCGILVLRCEDVVVQKKNTNKTKKWCTARRSLTCLSLTAACFILPQVAESGAIQLLRSVVR